MAKYRQSWLSYKVIPPGKIQVTGFRNSDSYSDVIRKAVEGLDIKSSPEKLKLIVSGGLVRNTHFQDGSEWNLGGFIKAIGGAQLRNKKTFGICVPVEELYDENENEYTLENEKTTSKRVKLTDSKPVSSKLCLIAIHVLEFYQWKF